MPDLESGYNVLIVTKPYLDVVGKICDRFSGYKEKIEIPTIKMLSKNEVIIANCLHKYKKQLTYAYEDKLKLDSASRTVKPDFTIENLTTRKKFYWEHLGMMTKTDYRENGKRN